MNEQVVNEIRQTTFDNCIIHDDCVITNNNLIRNTEIMSYCHIEGCGKIDFNGISHCGEGTELLIGNEVGKRVIPINISFISFLM